MLDEPTRPAPMGSLSPPSPKRMRKKALASVYLSRVLLDLVDYFLQLAGRQGDRRDLQGFPLLRAEPQPSFARHPLSPGQILLFQRRQLCDGLVAVEHGDALALVRHSQVFAEVRLQLADVYGLHGLNI